MSNNYFTDIYSKRINRFGNDYQSRIEGKRAREFEDFLLKTPNRVDFEHDGTLVAAALEQYKQDYTETQGYLLTTKEVNMPNGTVISFKDKRDETNYWMVWWLEQIKTSGYHRYVILKMSHCLEWSDNEGTHEQWGYLSGPGMSEVRDAAVTGRGGARFGENNNLHLFVTPYNKAFERDFYIETMNGEKTSAYRVAEFDNQTTKGVSYLYVDPIAIKNKAPEPIKTKEDAKESFFWLNGGEQA